MKKRRRAEEEDSSLELLLDTMCNTFGGVMFIAISIFVIISGMTQIEQQEVEAEPIDTIALQQQLSSLSLSLKELQFQMQNKTRELESRKAIDQTDQLEKLQKLTKLSKELEAQQKILDTANKAVNKALQRSHRALQNTNRQTKQLEQKIKKIERELLSLYAELNKLKNTKIASKRMVFKMIKTSNAIPYFIIIHQKHAYPVGPDNRDQSGFHPAAQVRNVEANGQKYMICSINPGKGMAVMNGKYLSNDFRNFLSDLPYNRAPMFFIYPNSAETVHKMREELKKMDMLHGLLLSTSDSSNLSLVYTDKKEYEY